MLRKITQLPGFSTISKKWTVVFLRHGESIANQQRCFSGWNDVRLSSEGIKQSFQAGKILYQNGFDFNICYTSTFNYAADELHCHSIPVLKSWRLNERHYGILQGKSKRKMVEKYGLEKVREWRTKFDSVPPPVESGDPRHPANDPRYSNVDKNLLPSSQSLKMTQERVMPFWQSTVVPPIREDKKILIIGHGNLLKVLFKKLKNMSDSEIEQISIPLTIPILFHFNEDMAVTETSYLADSETLSSQIKKTLENQSDHEQ